MIDYTTLGNVTGIFPNIVGKNATGAGLQDGTPFVAAFIDDLWGSRQAMMVRAGLTPDGVTESQSASQYLEAIKLGLNLGAGRITQYMKNGSPATNGDREIILTGQGILRASYTELDTAVYVGDTDNATVAAAGGAFYRADNSDGSSPSTTGIYLIMPDGRGRVPRGQDTGATVDPDGASRYLGGVQGSAMWGHKHNGFQDSNNYGVSITSAGLNAIMLTGTSVASTAIINTAITDGTHGTPTLSSESRMTNFQTIWAITY